MADIEKAIAELQEYHDREWTEERDFPATRETRKRVTGNAIELLTKYKELKSSHETIVKAADDMLAELKERRWIPVDKRKPEHHEFVILTGIEAINNKRVYAIKCWDRDTWRPCNSAPSIFWDYWHKLPEPPMMD